MAPHRKRLLAPLAPKTKPLLAVIASNLPCHMPACQHFANRLISTWIFPDLTPDLISRLLSTQNSGEIETIDLFLVYEL